MDVKIKAILIGKNLFRKDKDTWIVKLDFVEETPEPPIIQQTGDIAREIAPIIQQTLQMFTPGLAQQTMPRLTLWLTDDEWETLEKKPDIGDEVTITITDKKEIKIG
ncbi:MAG: arcadin 1 [Thermoprotei archaeon]